MRCAVFAATKRGVETALRLKDGLTCDSVELYLKNNREKEISAKRFDRLPDAVAEAFQKYDALIFFMATGIAVRMIAPYLRGKLTDPAVLVADDRGCHIISLLSGHVGGGNALRCHVLRSGCFRRTPRRGHARRNFGVRAGYARGRLGSIDR